MSRDVDDRLCGCHNCEEQRRLQDGYAEMDKVSNPCDCKTNTSFDLWKETTSKARSVLTPFEEDPRFPSYFARALTLVADAQEVGQAKYGDNLAIIGFEGINLFALSKAFRIKHLVDGGTKPYLNDVMDLATDAMLRLTKHLMDEAAE